MAAVDRVKMREEFKKEFEKYPGQTSHPDNTKPFNAETNIVELAKQYPCNVLTEDVFQKSIRDIFNLLANIVGKTVGPYGAATMIESMGDYHLTKDGFTVLKNIHFNNRKDNTILNLILTISHQMVMKVGDGSTTAILAAHEFIELMRENEYLKRVRPKDVQILIREYVEKLCQNIQNHAKPVTDENYVEIMEKVARIALNDDDEYTRFIKEIYEQSGIQTSISKRESLTEKAHYTIMDDMFFIAGRYIDKVYCNAEHQSKCNLTHPYVLLFNFTLGNEHWDMIKLAYRYLQKTDPTARMLVIAPNYNEYISQCIANDAAEFMSAYTAAGNAGAYPFPMVFAKNPYFKNVERSIFEDLAPFLGTRIINPLDGEKIVKQITEYYKITANYNQALDAQEKANKAYNQMVNAAVQNGKDPREIERPVIVIPDQDGVKEREELEDIMGKFFGRCDAVSVGEENIEFHGFSHMNQNMVEIHTEEAKDQYRKELAEIENQRYISKQYIEAKERLARIACKSAMIYVGGNNTLEKKMNDDALDDAIHACQSTVNYGYTPGNNIAIFRAIDEVQETLSPNSPMHSVGETLYKSFENVIYRIHANKNPNIAMSEVCSIIRESVEKDMCFDLNTEMFTPDIINSARTDIEVLMSAITIIGTILSANQYLATEIQVQKDSK